MAKVTKDQIGQPYQPSAPRPLVDAITVTDFGGIEETSAFRDDAQNDYTYVRGFSDLRRAQDLAKIEVRDGLRKAKDVPILPVNCRWVRCAGSYTKTGSTKAQGYRAVTKNDLDAKHDWLTGLPPGAQLNPAGEITTAAGDLVLMVADGETAARNAIRKQRKATAMAEAVGAEDQGFMAVGNKMKGVNPTITAQPG